MSFAKPSSQKDYLPSETEIKAACRQIRREWSVGERQSRRVGGEHAWKLLILPRPVFPRESGRDNW